MEPVLALDAPTVRVEPGGERRVRLEVRNPGPDVERYRLDVLGEAARWSQVEPRHVEVPPGPQSQVVEVVFRPPQAATAPTRDIPFGVRAQSLQHRDRAGVVEGDLVVSAVREVRARIEPTAATGRWGAGFRVVLDNEGRSPVTVAVTGSDTRAALRFAVSPAAPQVPPGGTATALVSVRLRRPRLVGGQVQHPFGVEYRGDGDPSVGRLPAALTQRAVLPVAVAVLLALLVLAAAGLGVSLLVRGLADGPGPGAGPAAGPGAGPEQATGGAPADPVSGFLVIYGPPTPVDDTVNKEATARFAGALEAAGIDARIVDSRTSDQLDDGLTGLLVVLRDGFPDRASAAAECAAHRDIAPGCVVVAPR